MAWENPLFCPGGLSANADLSAKQFYCVKMSATANKVALCDTDGEVTIGVLQDKPASGEASNVMMVGITKVVAAEALSPGDTWGTDANGKAKKVEGTVTGADVGDFAAGIVIEGTSGANELATVTVGITTFKVEAQ